MIEQDTIEPGNEAAPIKTMPSTLKGLKRQATKIKRESGIRHAEALAIKAQAMGYTSYKTALASLADKESDV